jgi:hypothetical protein
MKDVEKKDMPEVSGGEVNTLVMPPITTYPIAPVPGREPSPIVVEPEAPLP